MNEVIVINRRATFDYQILEKYEAGIELKGWEVKAIKTGHINLAGSFAAVKDDQIWLTNADIPPYQPANTPPDYDPGRSRRLLLKKSQIKELIGKTKEQGLTLVPLRVYIKNRRIKIELGLASSRKKTDKREAIKKREWFRLRRNLETR